MTGAWKRWAAGALVAVVLVSASAAYATSVKNLPPRYREWLTRDVVYLITNEERQAFLLLPTDEARDKFIEQFWELRNPTPGAPTNPYRDEIYQRLAYVNQWFGRGEGIEGWRSDQGRVYITLGKPQQVSQQVGFANVRNMEIWFYQNAHPALPPFFYVVFYQPEAGRGYQLYSPYMDGPEKLVSEGRTQGNRLAALQVIDKEEGREVARTVLSLIPDEPVDFEQATTSLMSDVMLSTIKGLANNPFTKDMLNEHRRLLEAVTHRVLLGGEFLDVLTVPLLDRGGNPTLHYVLRLKQPEDFALAESKESTYYYSAQVAIRVLTPDDKLIFTQMRKLSRYLDASRMEQVKRKVFGYEGMLPLPPGKYKIEFLLSNELKKTAFRERRDVVIPAPPASGLSLTDIVPFSDARTGEVDENTPFAVAGVKFTPMIGQGISVVQGADFKFFYQIWAPPADPKSYGQGKLNVEYAYGRLGAHDTRTLKDEVLKSQFDVTGTMINGKKIPTSDLLPGNYRLMITLSDPDSQLKAYSSLNFHVVTNAGPLPAWDITDEEAAKEDARRGIPAYDRGLCYLAQGQAEPALRWIKQAYEKNPNDEDIRGKLVELLYARQDFAQVAKLYGAGGISGQTNEQTILRMAESLDKLGQLNKSIQLLEAALPLKESSALYLTLAGYYQKVGNAQKAAEMERKGKTMANGAPPS